MRWKKKESWNAKMDRLNRWHPWFAWHPVQISHHNGEFIPHGDRTEYAWFIVVQRRIHCMQGYDFPEYQF